MNEWQEQANTELAHARSARRQGKEGMARVCARRAAGIIAGEYLRREGVSVSDPSAYHRLQVLLGMPGLSIETRQATEALLLRVNSDHTLPVQVDLIAAAGWLASALLQVVLE